MVIAHPNLLTRPNKRRDVSCPDFSKASSSWARQQFIFALPGCLFACLPTRWNVGAPTPRLLRCAYPHQNGSGELKSSWRYASVDSSRAAFGVFLGRGSHESVITGIFPVIQVPVFRGCPLPSAPLLVSFRCHRRTLHFTHPPPTHIASQHSTSFVSPQAPLPRPPFRYLSRPRHDNQTLPLR